MFVLPSLLQGECILYMVPEKKLRKCLRASPAAEQRGADSCLTDILGASSTPGIIMGLIGRSVCGRMGIVNVDRHQSVFAAMSLINFRGDATRVTNGGTKCLGF